MMTHDAHRNLTEPEVRRHLKEDHGWSAVICYQHTYFESLVEHDREHRKAALQKAAS